MCHGKRGGAHGRLAWEQLRLVDHGKSWPWILQCLSLLEMGRKMLLAIIDVFSKFALAIPTKNQKATTVGKILVEEIFNRFGCPEQIHSDQGKNFEGQLVQELCKRYQVNKSPTSPYHPQGNGVCERFNRTMHGMLATLCKEQREQWPRYLSSLTAIYNSTPHAVTGFSPHYLVFGVEPYLPMDRFTVGYGRGCYYPPSVRPEDEQGYEKVLHGSNLRPLRAGYCEGSSEQQQQDKGPQHVEGGQISKEDEEGKQVDEEEVEMPDMTEVLRRFGFDDGSPSRVEEDRNDLTTIPECEKIEEAGQEREEDQVIRPECEQAGEETSQKKETN
ncbi:uncharacterized protein LOC135115599 [Scylla paramamosain]|uniref:uncharacterized protein LOC135115599 n=1 Tax=Scylla paramamosain TaxID=85552 RepID=UPI0030837541